MNVSPFLDNPPRRLRGSRGAARGPRPGRCPPGASASAPPHVGRGTSLAPHLLLIHGGSFLFEDPLFEPLTRARGRRRRVRPPLPELPARRPARRPSKRRGPKPSRLNARYPGRVYAYGTSAGGTLAALLAGDGMVEAAVAKAPVSDLVGWRWPLDTYGSDYYEQIGATHPGPVPALAAAPPRAPPAADRARPRRPRSCRWRMSRQYAAKFKRVHLWVVQGGHHTERTRPELLSRAFQWLARIAGATDTRPSLQEALTPLSDVRTASTRQDPTDAGFRPDIEGLRAVAIVAVLLCHAGLPFFAGGYVGVDVFFVISGFLITRLLLGELESTGRLSLRRFYARRARRLLPLSAVLLASVGILSVLLLSPVRAVEVSGDIVSSALYTANWHFAAQSVDYFAQDIEPSPVLHLWSLAIEEQFYVVWPSLLLAVTWLWRRRGGSVRPALWVTLAIVLVGSFALGVKLTDDQPAAAYFSTFGRAWELGLGAALALLGALRIRRARRRRRSAGPASPRSSTPPSPSTRARRSPGPPPCCRPSAPPA